MAHLIGTGHVEVAAYFRGKRAGLEDAAAAARSVASDLREADRHDEARTVEELAQRLAAAAKEQSW
jgi:hypothetical protein